MPRSAKVGRPLRSSREQVAEAALSLFVAQGFERTTLDQIAAAAHVSRRTVLRYFGSKNDIVWGTFEEHLHRLAKQLASAPPQQPLIEVVRQAVVSFNDYGAAAQGQLRDRMTLITTVPALQGHAMLRYAQWCDVIAAFAAGRLEITADHHVCQALANAVLGVAMATYRHWIAHPEDDLLTKLDEGLALLCEGFAEPALRRAVGGER